MIEKSKHFGTIIPFVIAIIALLALSYFSYNKIKNLIEEATWVNHANLVKVSLEKSFAVLREKESDMRVYMFSKDSVYLSSYLAADTSILLELNRLESLIRDNPLQQQNAIALKTAIDARIEMMKYNLALFQASKLSTADRLKGNALMDDVRSHIDKMETEEDKLISIRSTSFGRSAFVTPLFTIFLIIGSVTLLIVSYFKISQAQNKYNALSSNVENRVAELVIDNYARSLIEASLDPLVTISADGKILDVNAASIKVTGIPREKLIDTDFSNYFTEPEKAREGYLQVFEKGFVSDYPLTIKHKDGILTDVLYNASVYKDNKGNVLGVFAAARDVTEQKQASQYARSLIEASLDPLVTISADGKILDVNAASIKVTGIPREKLIDTDFSNYFTEPEKAREGYLQVFEKGFVSDYPLTIKHKDGILTDVLYNASVYMDIKGNVLGVFAAARDVTEQKQASQYARSLIEANLDPLVTISANGKITDVNAASIKVTGIPREKLIGTDFTKYFTEPKKAQEGYLQVFEKGYVSDYPLTIKHKDGNLTDVLYNASVYKDSKGKILGVFAAARDVTEQKWAKDLRVANKELAFQNDEKEKRAAELNIANKELAFQNNEKEKRAAELTIANIELAFENDEKGKRADELSVANIELAFQSEEKEKRAIEKEKRAIELATAYAELAFQNKEKEKRAAELNIASIELAFQNDEKGKRAEELIIANKELAFQSEEKGKRAVELSTANTKLAFQNNEKEKRAAELSIANIELAFQSEEKGKRSDELTVANKELAFQNNEKEKRAIEKEKRAIELGIAYAELAFQNKEKEKRAAELSKANVELAFQNDEKENRAAELVIANKELAYQNDEKEKRAAELVIANKELAYQNDEKEKRAAELSIANIELAFQNDEKGKRADELTIAIKELAFQNDEKENRAAELVIANKELESFNYISSHDLQEPLRKIQVFASYLIADESQNLSTKGIDHVFRMQDAANRMQALIADLLAYSRTTSSERIFEITDLNTILESVKKDFADALDAKNAIIETAEMCDVRVIPFQFRQLLDNIIGNALKFAKPDLPPHIIIKSSIIKGSEVKSPKLLSEKLYSHITITDNGLGFEPQYKDQIFELFKRLHDKENMKGTGIGLSIVKKIVDNHNGLITATSELNKGATFDIYIPTN